MKRTLLAVVALALLPLGCKKKDEAKPASKGVQAPALAPKQAPPPPPAFATGPAPNPLATGKAPTPPVPLAEYFRVERVGGASFSHDEQWIAYASDRSGKMNLWLQPVAGGAPRQLTDVKGYVHSFAFSPAADVLLYEADQGGDELTHIYVTSSKGEPPTDLTPELPKGTRTQFVRWAEDGKTFLYLCSKRDPQALDLYEMDLATKKSTMLWQASGKLSLERASRDLRRFAIGETLSDANFNVHVYERGAKEPVLVTAHEGEVMFGAFTFTPDGQKLVVGSDEGGEFTGAYTIDLKTRQRVPTVKAPWDVDGVGFSRTGKYTWQLVNEDGAARVTWLETATAKPVTVPHPGGPGSLRPVAFSRTDRYVAAELIADTTARTPYVLDLQAGTARKLVDPMPEALRGRAMVDGRAVRIKSFDGKEVPAFVYAPPGPGPFPALIDVHGGPTAQSKRGYSSYRQYFVSKGWVVLVPNVRGSTGYGKTWMRADNLDLGGGPLRDVVACKQWLAQNAGVDPARVVVMGGSYGGYMALAAAAFQPKEFAANVDYFGPSDLKTMVESFPPWWAAFATFIYQKFGNPKDPAHAKYQRERSPIHFVERIERPLLVVQGKNDPRVRQDQSDRIVEALRARKVPVHYLLLPDEGHGFSSTANLEKVIALTDRFLDRYVWGDASVKVD